MLVFGLVYIQFYQIPFHFDLVQILIHKINIDNYMNQIIFLKIKMINRTENTIKIFKLNLTIILIEKLQCQLLKLQASLIRDIDLKFFPVECFSLPFLEGKVVYLCDMINVH